MKLLINTASCMRGGSVQVAYSFIRECLSISGNDYGIIVGPSLQGLLREQEWPENFQVFNVDRRPAQKLGTALKGDCFDDIERAFQPDVVFTTSGPAYWKSKVPHLIGYNLAHYIYPDSPYFKQISAKEKMRWGLMKQAIKYFYNRDADALVVQTDDVRERALKLLRCDKIHTVYNTCGEHFFDPPKQDGIAIERESGCVYLLYLTAYYAHKNIEIINQVIPLLEARKANHFRFVLTLSQADFERAILPENRSIVTNLGPVPPEACPELYEQSDFVFLPTLLECFSASYAEAMATGKPILTSDLGFARTVCQEAAQYFDPIKPESIADAILSLSADEKAQGEQILKGRHRLKTFNTARERAEKYLELCNQLL